MKERELAQSALNEITENNKHANTVLEEILRERDLRTQAFVRKVVYGVLDRRDELDRAIDKANRSKRKRLDPQIRNILRLSLYQLWEMDRTAAHGVVNDAVRLAKKSAPRYAGFVNGMLRNLARAVPEKQKMASMPAELRTRIMDVFGEEDGQRLLASLLETPHLCIRMNPLRTDAKELADIFQREGMQLTPSAVAPGVFRVNQPADVFGLAAYQKGYFSAQDEASARVVLHADPRPGEQWLDCCAAPGGKSTQLAEQMQNRGRILACDRSERKVKKIREHASRLGLTAIQPCVQDATVYVPEWKERFDGVLIDAPCSGLGLLRRKPDIKYRRTSNEIRELILLQTKILENNARYVKPGGKLIYSTCTILPEENEKQIHSFLTKNPNFQPDGEGFEYWSRMIDEGVDGFYMARLRKTAESPV